MGYDEEHDAARDVSSSIGSNDAGSDSTSSLRAAKHGSWPFSTTARGHRSWQMLIDSGAAISATVLIINIVMVALAYAKLGVVDQTATLWTGSCHRAGSSVVAAHVTINVLSSLVLAVSNVGLQCLASPTRAEVDAAHAKDKIFAIGTPNLRNVFMISRPRMTAWVLLAISSLPLHLLWNSSVFETLTTNDYYAVSVTENFLHGANWTVPEQDGLWSNIGRAQQMAQNGTLERLERSDCLKAYGREIVDDRRNLLMVTNVSDVWYSGHKSSVFGSLWLSVRTGCRHEFQERHTQLWMDV